MREAEESVYTLDHPAVVASLEAMSYGRKSWEAARDECYAWLKVRDNLDPGIGSNIGQRYISWIPKYVSRRKGTGHKMTNPAVYYITLRGPWGTKNATMHAPGTLDEARVSPLLGKAVHKRDSLFAALVLEYGEPRKPRNLGLSAEILKVLDVTPEGRDYRSRVKNPGRGTIRNLIDVAAAYEYDAWSRLNSRHVHIVFAAQPDRLGLLKRVWTGDEAIAEVKCRNAAKHETRDPFTLRDHSEISRKGRNSALYAANAARTFSHKLNENLPPKPEEELVEATIATFLEAAKTLDRLGELDNAWLVYTEQQSHGGYKLKKVA